MGRRIYVNGRFLPEAEANISVYDLSVMQGAAAFEMTRSFHHTHFKLPEHLDRLRRSCELLSIPLPVDFDCLPAICEDLTLQNAFPASDEHRLLIVVSPGCAPMYRDLDGVIPHPYCYVTDFPLRYTVHGMGKQFQGAMAEVVYDGQCTVLPAQAKHRSRLHFHLAQQEITRPRQWAILTVGDWLAECPGANIFIVKDGLISTPYDDCLHGISRSYIFDLATPLNLNTVQRRVGVDELYDADEVFVTGTPFCMLPIRSIDGRRIGKPGPVYRALLDAWSDSVGLNIAEQIQKWG